MATLICKHCGVEIKPVKFFLSDPALCARLGMPDYIISYLPPSGDHIHEPPIERRDIDPFVTEVPEEKNSSDS